MIYIYQLILHYIDLSFLGGLQKSFVQMGFAGFTLIRPELADLSLWDP